MSVEDILEWLDRRQIAATLTLEQSSVVRQFVFDSGNIISTSSNAPNEHIGQILLRAGLIDQRTLTWALDNQDESGMGFSRLVSSSGAVDEAQLRQLLEDLAREAVCRVMTWVDGTFVVERADERPIEVEFPIATALQPCIEAGRQRMARAGQGAQSRRPAEGPTARQRAGAASASSEPSVDSLVKQARQHAAAGKRSDAFHTAQLALSKQPTDAAIQKLFRDCERALFAELSRDLLTSFRVPRLLVERSELDGLGLTESERYLANRIDGRWDLLSLMKASPLREVEALITFKRLADRGIISL